MSYKVTALAMGAQQITGNEYLVLLTLARRADDGGKCWPSMDVIAQESHISEREARYCIAGLCKPFASNESRSILQRTVGGGRGNPSIYNVNLELLLDLAEAGNYKPSKEDVRFFERGQELPQTSANPAQPFPLYETERGHESVIKGAQTGMERGHITDVKGAQTASLYKKNLKEPKEEPSQVHEPSARERGSAEGVARARELSRGSLTPNAGKGVGIPATPAAQNLERIALAIVLAHPESISRNRTELEVSPRDSLAVCEAIMREASKAGTTAADAGRMLLDLTRQVAEQVPRSEWRWVPGVTRFFGLELHYRRSPAEFTRSINATEGVQHGRSTGTDGNAQAVREFLASRAQRAGSTNGTGGDRGQSEHAGGGLPDDGGTDSDNLGNDRALRDGARGATPRAGRPCVHPGGRERNQVLPFAGTLARARWGGGR